MAGNAFVTLATSDTYGLGALVLAHSLRAVNTSAQLVVLITPGVTAAMRSQLSSVFDLVEEVNLLDSRDEANLALLTRPELGVTFTKMHCWTLTQYSKAVFLDADTLVVQNCDELFEREELSAVPDVGWPDCFNSGVFVFQPSRETYKALIQFALEKGSFDGGDQGVLNQFFSNWATEDIRKHLSFIYNMNSNASYTYLPAYKRFGKDVKIIHFLGSLKPWSQAYNIHTRNVEPRGGSLHAREHLQAWWDLFMACVQPHLQETCDPLFPPEAEPPPPPPPPEPKADLAGRLARMDLSGESSEQSSQERQYAWERGQIDYLGADAFSNIQKMLDKAIQRTE